MKLDDLLHQREAHTPALPVLLFLLLLWCPRPLEAQPVPAEIPEVPQTRSSDERLSSLMELIATHLETDPSRVLVYGMEALALLEDQPDSERHLQVLSALCFASYRRDQHEAALDFGDRAEGLARKMGKSSELAFVLTYLGNAARRLGEHHRGLTFSLEAVGLYEKLGDRSGVGKAANGVGYAYWRLGEYPKALTYYLRAQEAYAAAQNRRGVGQTFRNIATLYSEIRQPRKALELYQQALAIQQEEGNEREIGKLYSDMGQTYIGSATPPMLRLGPGPAVEISRWRRSPARTSRCASASIPSTTSTTPSPVGSSMMSGWSTRPPTARRA